MKQTDRQSIQRAALLLIALTFALVALLANRAVSLSIRVVESDMLPSSHSAVLADLEVQERFGGDEGFVIAVEAEAPEIDHAKLEAAYRQLARIIAADDFLAALFIDGLDRDRFADSNESNSDQHSALLVAPSESLRKRYLDANTLTSRLRRSRDGRALLLHQPAFASQTEAVLIQLERAITEFKKHADPGIRTRLLGSGLVQATLGERIETDLQRFLPWIMGLTLLLFLCAFQSLWLALLALSEVGIATVLTLGALESSGHSLSLMTSLIPVFLTALCVADDIHLFAEYFRIKRIDQTIDRSILAIQAARSVTRPVSLTTLTTAIAFLSFVFTDIQALRVFGLFAAIGTLISWFLTLYFVPAVMTLLPLSEGPAWVHNETQSTQSSSSLTRSLLGWRAAGLLSLLLLPGLSRLTLNDGWTHNFEPGDQIVEDAQWLENESFGLQRFDVALRHPATWNSETGLQRLAEISKSLTADPLVVSVISLVDLLEERNWELAGRVGDTPSLPSGAASLETAVRSFRWFNEEFLLRSYLDDEARWTRLAVFMRGDNFGTATKLRASILSQIERQAGEPLEVQIGGSAERGRVMVASMVSTQLLAVASSLALLLFILALVTGKLRDASKCLLCVSWSLLLVLGVAGWMDWSLGVASSCFMGIALGVGIDYSVHLTYSSLSGLSPEVARRSIARRVVWDVVIVGVALCVLQLSHNPTIRSLGRLLVLSMAVSAYISIVTLTHDLPRSPWSHRRSAHL